MTQVMNVKRLLEIISAYGAAPGHWPAEERVGAQTLLERIQTMGTPAERQALQAAMAEAEELDGALAGFAAPVSDAAMARLTAAVAFPPARNQAWAKKTETHFDLFAVLHMIFKPAAAVGATMAALGLFVGFAVDPAYSSGDGSDYTVAQSADAAFSALGQDDGETTP